MASIARCRVAWSGSAVVGDGLSTFYWGSGGVAGYPGAVLAFFNAIKGLVPVGVTWTVPSSGDLLDDTTGALQGSWSIAGGGTVASAGGTTYAAGVGSRVVWQTGAIRGGRRVRGSTFIVPLGTTQYDADGTIAPAALTTLGTAAANYLTAVGSNGLIWSRPRTGLAGQAVPITAALTPDKVSWLRGRRT